MEIEVDRSAIFASECKFNTAPKIETDEEEGGIAGWSYGNEIALVPQNPLAIIIVFCHEVGHFMGNKYSFKERAFFNERPKNVLTFDEIKKTNISLNLTEDEQILLKNTLSENSEVEPDETHFWIAKKLLRVFFRGHFNYRDLKILIFSKKEMREDIDKHPPLGSEKRDGEVVALNAKDGRNRELASFYTEYGCLLILENTLKKYGLMSDAIKFGSLPTDLPSHQRAVNIIARAYAGEGWRIPSMVDIDRKS